MPHAFESAQLLWIIDIYGFFVAGFLVTMGNLGDRYGRRKLLLCGAAAFAVASTVAAFSTSAEMLIVMRALLGIAGATLAPSTMSLIRNMFHHDAERQLAIGIWIASFSVGGAIGPLVGGVMLQFFWWGSVFLVAVPVMVALLLLGPVLLPEYRDERAGRIDAWSVALSLAAVLSATYGLKQLAEHGAAAMPAAALVLGLGTGWVFVRRQRRLAYPLVDLELFKRAAFGAAISAYALSCLAMFGVYIFFTQYLQLVLGLSPLAAGLATAPSSLGFVVGSLLAPRFTRRLAPVQVLVWGLVAAAAGFGLMLGADSRFSLALVVAGSVVMSLGLAPVFTVGNDMIITAAPPERAGAASALSETSAELSGALGVAVFGSVGMVLYRQALAGGLPNDVPAEAADAASATLGGAVSAAAALPAPLGSVLLDASRAPFTEALQATGVSGAMVVLAAAVIAGRILARR